MSYVQVGSFDITNGAVPPLGLVEPHELAALPADMLVVDDQAQVDEQSLLMEVGVGLLDAFAEDCASPCGYACLMALDPASAQRTYDLLIDAFFPDRRIDPAMVADAAVFAMAGLMTAAGNGPAAFELLRASKGDRHMPDLQRGWFAARCHASGSSGLSGLWLTPAGAPATLDDAQAAMEAQPLDVGVHRRLVHGLAKEGACPEALAALCTALSLPLSQGERMPLAGDLATLATVLEANGDGGVLRVPRVRLALKANPGIAMRAMAMLASPDLLLTKVAGREAVAAAASFLHGFANPVDIAVRSPYPMRNGKPHVDTVWLEITNFCNQKCTFCPDMHREDSREWLPLAEVKRLIDELLETVSVGSMQLNAYGEPLLHPHIKEILAYIREQKLPWPTFFTSHGMTLVPKKLAQLSHNYPTGIALSLHNDSQESYEATRSAKIGDYDTLVSRVSDLLRQMTNEGAPCNMRLYQMVTNGQEDLRVDARVRAAFPGTVERLTAHVRKWEAIAAEIAAQAPPEVRATARVNDPEVIAEAFRVASHDDTVHLRILEWYDVNGVMQHAFMSARPVSTYANLLLEYHPDWKMERKIVNAAVCGFVNTPSLAIFATRKLGICCVDMNSTGTFGSLDDYPTLVDALTSPEAARMFAEVGNGVTTSMGCQICLGEGRNLCAS